MECPHCGFSFNNPCLLGESLSIHFCIFFKLMMLGIRQGFPGHLLIPLGKCPFRSFDNIIKSIVSMNSLLLDLLDIVYENVSSQSLAVCGRSVHQLLFQLSIGCYTVQADLKMTRQVLNLLAASRVLGWQDVLPCFHHHTAIIWQRDIFNFDNWLFFLDGWSNFYTRGFFQPWDRVEQGARKGPKTMECNVMVSSPFSSTRDQQHGREKAQAYSVPIKPQQSIILLTLPFPSYVTLS